jgi:hypothetical protein
MMPQNPLRLFELRMTQKSKSSFVWNYFSDPVEKDGKKHVRCMVSGCKKPLLAYNGNTSPMITHLTKVHSITAQTHQAKKQSDGPARQQAKIPAMTKEQVQLQHRRAAAMCAMDLRCALLSLCLFNFFGSPLATVEGEGFRLYSKGLNAAYKPCSANTCKEYVKNLFDDGVQTVRGLIVFGGLRSACG